MSTRRKKKVKTPARVDAAPPVTGRVDGWRNFLTGLGTNIDKRRGNNFFLNSETFSREIQEEAWEGDAMVARVLEKPCYEMMRSGFDFTISDAQESTTIEATSPGDEVAGKYDSEPRETRMDYIRKMGNKWCVYSEGGKMLGSYRTKSAAVARLRQIEGHKNHPDAARRGGVEMPDAARRDAGEMFGGISPTSAPKPFPAAPAEKPPGPVAVTGHGTKPVEDAVMGRYDELHGPERFLEALLYEAAYGGSAIFLGADDGQEDLTQPLDLENIKTFKWANVFTPREMQAVRYYGDPAEPKYGEPMIYRAMPDINLNVDMSVSGGPTLRYRAPIWVTREIHESRLIIFPGIVVSKRHRYRRKGWGDSRLVRLLQEVADFQSAYDGAHHLVTDFAQAVFKIKGLADLIMQNADDVVGKRLQLIDMSRSLARAIMLDSEEEFKREATPLAGLPELLQRFEHKLAAAADMPVSILMGREPSGLNATGDAELEAWYNTIAARQNQNLKPRLERFLRIIMLAKDGPTKGVEPENWSLEFRPLAKPRESEQADIRLKQAQTDVAYITAGVLTPEEVAQSRFGGPSWSDKTTLDVEQREQAVADFERKQAEAEEEQENQLAAMKGRVGTLQNLQMKNEKDRTALGTSPGELPAVK